MNASPRPRQGDRHDQQDEKDQVGEGGGEVDHLGKERWNVNSELMEDNLATRSNPLGQADQHYHPGEEEPEGEVHPDFKSICYILNNWTHLFIEEELYILPP